MAGRRVNEDSCWNWYAEDICRWGSHLNIHVYVIVISEDFPVYEALHQIGQWSCPIWCNVLYTRKSSDLNNLSLIPHLWNWPTNYNIVTSLRQDAGATWSKAKLLQGTCVSQIWLVKNWVVSIWLVCDIFTPDLFQNCHLKINCWTERHIMCSAQKWMLPYQDLYFGCHYFLGIYHLLPFGSSELHVFVQWIFIQAFCFVHSIIHWFVPSFPSRLHSVSFLYSFSCLHSVSFLYSFHSCIYVHASIQFHCCIHFHLCFYFHFNMYDHSYIHFHSWINFIHFQSSLV